MQIGRKSICRCEKFAGRKSPDGAEVLQFALISSLMVFTEFSAIKCYGTLEIIWKEKLEQFICIKASINLLPTRQSFKLPHFSSSLLNGKRFTFRNESLNIVSSEGWSSKKHFDNAIGKCFPRTLTVNSTHSSIFRSGKWFSSHEIFISERFASSSFSSVWLKSNFSPIDKNRFFRNQQMTSRMTCFGMCVCVWSVNAREQGCRSYQFISSQWDWVRFGIAWQATI